MAAGTHRWSPVQLRHSAAMEAPRLFREISASRAATLRAPSERWQSPVYGSCLESSRPARARGFESLPLRLLQLQLVLEPGAGGRSGPVVNGLGAAVVRRRDPGQHGGAQATGPVGAGFDQGIRSSLS